MTLGPSLTDPPRPPVTDSRPGRTRHERRPGFDTADPTAAPHRPDEMSWPQEHPPRLDTEVVSAWDWDLHTPADVTASRRQLRAEALAPELSAGVSEDDDERLLLAFEELASNGVRHGRAPVRTTVAARTSGWLIDVTDAATDHSPVPAVDRDPALGGLGLHLIAGLCARHGWAVQAGRKHVWGYVRLGIA